MQQIMLLNSFFLTMQKWVFPYISHILHTWCSSCSAHPNILEMKKIYMWNCRCANFIRWFLLYQGVVLASWHNCWVFVLCSRMVSLFSSWPTSWHEGISTYPMSLYILYVDLFVGDWNSLKLEEGKYAMFLVMQDSSKIDIPRQS